jgi:hypothetical protein
MQNDGTPFKPVIEYDESQQLCVGLDEDKDIYFVSQNPNPDPDYFKQHIVTEANVSFITSADNKVSLPLAVHYKPRAGKIGEDMKKQEAIPLRACDACLGRNQQCKRIVVLVLSTDCEAGNKAAMEMIIEGIKNGTISAEFLFIIIPDVLHAGCEIRGVL